VRHADDFLYHSLHAHHQQEKQKDEAPPEPQLADAPQQIQISTDLEMSSGGVGSLFSANEIRNLTGGQAIADEAFDVSELEKRPEAVSQVAPVYPAELRKAKIEGSVTLAFLLNESGRVEDARVENSSRPEFEKPALDAIRRWRFRPGMKSGQPVRTYMRIPIKFHVASS
jgi:TonB family protein